MKILHTSDWHLGAELYGFSRKKEHENFFCQLKTIIVENDVDVLIVSGDIFHTSMPKNEIVEFYNRTMIDLHNVKPSMQIVIISGNHDSGLRLNADKQLWDLANVFVSGIPSKEPENQIVSIKNNSNEIIGYVVAVPYFLPCNAPVENVERDQKLSTYINNIYSKLKEINTDNLPIIIASHLTIKGVKLQKEHEILQKDQDNNIISVGGVESVDVNIFGKAHIDYDYVALGHIHLPFKVGENAYYSGTPVAINFDEKFNHFVNLLEIDKHGQEVKITKIEIFQKIPLITIPQQPKPKLEALEELKNLDKDKECFVRVNLLFEHNEMFSEEDKIAIRQIFNDKKAVFCSYKIERKELQTQENEQINLSAEVFKQIEPYTLTELYLKNNDKKLSEKAMEYLKDIIKEFE